MTAKNSSWTKDAVSAARPISGRSFTTELMLHVLISERYTGWPTIVDVGSRVLDVGALHAGNLAPCADRGGVATA
jgi:hypothetical protein